MTLKRKLNLLTALVGSVAGLTACCLFIVYDIFGQNALEDVQLQTYLERDIVVVVVVMLIAVLLAQLMSRRFAREIASPFEALATASIRVTEKQDYGIRLAEKGNDELGLLASSFNQMMEVIESRDRDLRSAHELFDGFVNHSPTLALIKDDERRYVFVNFAARRLLGVSKQEILGKTDRELWPLDVAQTLETQDREATAGVVNFRQGDSQLFGVHLSTVQFPSPAGPRMIQMMRFQLRDAQGKAYMGCTAVDETERLLAEEFMRASEERYALAVRGASDGIWDWDVRKGEVYFSERCLQILGREQESPEPGRESGGLRFENTLDSLYARLHQPDLGGFRRALERLVAGSDEMLETEFRLGAKGDRWVLGRATGLRDEAGKAYRVAGFLTDITARKQQEAQLRKDAFHDALTGLPNRALFVDRLTQALERLKRYPSGLFAVLFMDLDGFKAINDTLGHGVGDQLLIEVANRLKKVTRTEDTVARLGGDEFTVLLEELSQPADVVRVADRIQAALRRPVEIGTQSLRTGGSIGITLSNRGYSRADEMIGDADTAMYLAKRQGKSTYRIFDASMHEAALTRLNLESEMRRGLEENAFLLYFQPVLDLASQRVVAVEALLRWQHPERGLLEPEAFLEAAEDCGLLNQLGARLIGPAMREVAQLPGSISLCLNLSMRQFQHPGVVDQLQAHCQEGGLEAARVRLEIGERALARDAEGGRQTMVRLRELGFELTLDDFGAGVSSLDVPRRFPFQAVKVDSRLVARCQPPDEDSTLVAGILRCCEGLGCQSVVVGVENAAQAAYFQAQGCRLAQGNFWSPPLSVEALRADLAAR